MGGFNGFFSFWCQRHSGTIKSCHRIEKMIFGHLKKNHLRPYYLFWHTKVSKNQFSLTCWQLWMVLLWSRDQKLKKHRNPPSKVYTEWAIAIWAVKISPSSPNIHFGWGFQLFLSAFYVSVTVVPLKVAIGLRKKISFGHLKKNHRSECQV